MVRAPGQELCEAEVLSLLGIRPGVGTTSGGRCTLGARAVGSLAQGRGRRALSSAIYPAIRDHRPTSPDHAVVLSALHREWEMAANSLTTSQINFIENVLGFRETEGSNTGGEEAGAEETADQDLLLSAANIELKITLKMKFVMNLTLLHPPRLGLPEALSSLGSPLSLFKCFIQLSVRVCLLSFIFQSTPKWISGSREPRAARSGPRREVGRNEAGNEDGSLMDFLCTHRRLSWFLP